MIIVDECHHAASDTFTRVLRNVNAKYIYMAFRQLPKEKTDWRKSCICSVVLFAMKQFISNTEYIQVPTAPDSQNDDYAVSG